MSIARKDHDAKAQEPQEGPAPALSGEGLPIARARQIVASGGGVRDQRRGFSCDTPQRPHPLAQNRMARPDVVGAGVTLGTQKNIRRYIGISAQGAPDSRRQNNRPRTTNCDRRRGLTPGREASTDHWLTGSLQPTADDNRRGTAAAVVCPCRRAFRRSFHDRGLVRQVDDSRQSRSPLKLQGREVTP